MTAFKSGAQWFPQEEQHLKHQFGKNPLCEITPCWNSHLLLYNDQWNHYFFFFYPITFLISNSSYLHSIIRPSGNKQRLNMRPNCTNDSLVLHLKKTKPYVQDADFCPSAKHHKSKQTINEYKTDGLRPEVLLEDCLVHLKAACSECHSRWFDVSFYITWGPDTRQSPTEHFTFPPH